MDDKIKKYTGAVSVEGDVTPITREPISTVKPVEWKDMTSSQLWEEKMVLQQRIAAAASCGHPELIVQIQRGIAVLDQYLGEKQSQQDDVLY